MINDQTTPQRYKRIREEGYTVLNVQDYLFHFKDTSWIKEFQCQKQKNWNLSKKCSGSVKPQNHILFALSLTLDMKIKAK